HHMAFHAYPLLRSGKNSDRPINLFYNIQFIQLLQEDSAWVCIFFDIPVFFFTIKDAEILLKNGGTYITIRQKARTKPAVVSIRKAPRYINAVPDGGFLSLI
ncbi:hypothetical protein LJC14_02845, partial [Treponema sp. OttesenSCG-928-L16]|nr:hypothetical protein [Treponema sp. OttesenSCG-928-L16]